MIEALLFDMDGVLADSEDVSITIGRMYFSTLGKNLERKDFEPHLGCGERTFFEGVANDIGIKNFSYLDASRFFKEHYQEMISKINISLPGAHRIIENAKKAGMKVAIASSAPKWKVYENIKAIGIDQSLLDLVVTGEDIVRNKPYGDIYQLCLIKFGLCPDQVVVFEDSIGGIKAAKNAKATVVSLTTTIDSESAFSSGADAVISDLSAFPDFSSKEDFTRKLDEICTPSSDCILYGANFIAPQKRKVSDSILEKNAIDAAWKAWDNSYSPYSKFKVGAAIVSARTGRIYSGTNVENSSYGGTICAERSAVLSAISAEAVVGIDLLVIVSDDDPPAPPCAICRQFLSEFSRPDTKVVLQSKNGIRVEYKFSDLLPYPFIMPAMRKQR